MPAIVVISAFSCSLLSRPPPQARLVTSQAGIACSSSCKDCIVFKWRCCCAQHHDGFARHAFTLFDLFVELLQILQSHPPSIGNALQAPFARIKKRRRDKDQAHCVLSQCKNRNTDNKRDVRRTKKNTGKKKPNGPSDYTAVHPPGAVPERKWLPARVNKNEYGWARHRTMDNTHDTHLMPVARCVGPAGTKKTKTIRNHLNEEKRDRMDTVACRLQNTRVW